VAQGNLKVLVDAVAGEALGRPAALSGFLPERGGESGWEGGWPVRRCMRSSRSQSKACSAVEITSSLLLASLATNARTARVARSLALPRAAASAGRSFRYPAAASGVR
jgi:hypothetical protein